MAWSNATRPTRSSGTRARRKRSPPIDRRAAVCRMAYGSAARGPPGNLPSGVNPIDRPESRSASVGLTAGGRRRDCRENCARPPSSRCGRSKACSIGRCGVKLQRLRYFPINRSCTSSPNRTRMVRRVQSAKASVGRCGVWPTDLLPQPGFLRQSQFPARSGGPATPFLGQRT